MSQNKLFHIAERQRDDVRRDRFFAVMMAMLIAFFILAVGSSSSHLVTAHDTRTAPARSIQEMIDTSTVACDRQDGPAMARGADSRPTC